jgi:hypothetical protein
MTMSTGDVPTDHPSSEVRAVCSAGPATFDLPWRDYVREFQLSPRHVPELLQIVTASEDVGDWADMHARRALGELRAVEVVDPLIAQAETDDGVVLDLPIVAGLIGPGAVPHLLYPLRRPMKDDDTVPIAAIESLSLVARWHRDARDDVEKLLCERLQAYPTQSRTINGALIAALQVLSPAACRETIDQVLLLAMYHTDHNLRAYPPTSKDAVASD